MFRLWQRDGAAASSCSIPEGLYGAELNSNETLHIVVVFKIKQVFFLNLVFYPQTKL
jgi:hypothetical protein